MSMKIRISDRARKYGYVTWIKPQDQKMREFLKDAESVELVFEGEFIGVKRVDWRFRRISVGYSRTRAIPKKATHYSLTYSEDGRLEVKCL